MTAQECIEGIVLRAMDYKETQRLVTLFSPTGLWHLVVKRLSSKRATPLLASSPFAKSECIVKRGRSELLSCVDLTLLDDYRALRTRYAYLHAAGELARAIVQTQLPGKSAPNLYHLFAFYLEQIPSFEEHASLIASFQLKLLKHEGLLTLLPHCALCSHAATHLQRGESLCAFHAPREALAFAEAEWGLLRVLCHARNMAELKALSLPEALAQRIHDYFYTNG